jgi:hypothetical protein
MISNPAASRHRGVRAPILARRILPLTLLLVALFAASAQAHTVTATATCKATTLNWTSFASSGTTNGGANTPEWKIVFTPTGGASITKTGKASFTGSASSLTIALPSANGTVAVSSSWTAAETRDASSGSYSTALGIGNCSTTTPSTSPKISTTASPGVAMGGTVHDTAMLSGGSSPTGTISFALYAAADKTCATALKTVTSAVNGNGTYTSPSVTPSVAGAYQWVARYSGDANNAGIAAPCVVAAEQVMVSSAGGPIASPAPGSPAGTPAGTSAGTPVGAPAVAPSTTAGSGVAGTHAVRGTCTASPAALIGVVSVARRSVKAHVPARGIKSVTFSLDGHRRKTMSKAKHDRFSIGIDVTKLGYGKHRLTAKITMKSASCAHAALAATFVRAKSAAVAPAFTG